MRRVGELMMKPFGGARGSVAGLSLIEIIMVISLLAVIMGILVRNVTERQDNALQDSARLGMQGLMQSLQEYRIHNLRYPTSEQGLQALLENPGSKRWRGPYVEASKLNDPWDQPYGYEADGRNVRLVSGGSNGQIGDEDDIRFPDDDTEE